jgi:CIC family chloride channel protein
MLMVAEMTGQFSLLVPAMFAATAAYLVSGDTGIYENQVATRADSPAHREEYGIPLIQMVTVGRAMRRDVTTATPAESIAVAERRMLDAGLRGLPVVDQGRLVGIITATDALQTRRTNPPTVGEAMHTDLVLAYPTDSLHTALQRMSRAGISRLPVVEPGAPDRLVGILTSRDLATALDLELSAFAEKAARATPAPGSDRAENGPSPPQ